MIWVDAHLSPAVAKWLDQQFGHPARSLRSLGLHGAPDEAIFQSARAAGAIVLTKDADFVELLARLGPPPSVIWLTCGNTSHRHLCAILSAKLRIALDLLESGSPLVEIRG